jgi:hypothetical protein
MFRRIGDAFHPEDAGAPAVETVAGDDQRGCWAKLTELLCLR